LGFCDDPWEDMSTTIAKLPKLDFAHL